MTKSDLIEAIAQSASLTKDKASIVVNEIFDQMVEAMKDGERIEIRNFGNFTVRTTTPTTAATPRPASPCTWLRSACRSSRLASSSSAASTASSPISSSAAEFLGSSATLVHF